MQSDRWRGRRVGLIAGVVALACSGGAYASIAGLPPGTQINNDPPSIDPTQNAGLVDLTAGSLVAGNPRVPWATFSQALGTSQQIFVRAFKGGSWQTEGFPESLNEDTTQVAQAPSIDFTGANRTVPWVAWAETSTVPAFSGARQIFASRFASQPAPAQNGGQWVHEGQQVPGTAPSLNINTNRDADVPALIGGTTSTGGNPAPWITWQEADNGNTTGPAGSPGSNKVPNNSTFQIFVSHAVPATGGNCPAGTKPAHGTTSVGNFCFQQVGIERAKNPSLAVMDPSLNVDPSRDGIQADIAFTGTSDNVPWVVWYENSDNGIVTNGLLNADMVFAARGIADASGDGGFHWQVVGLGTAGKTAAQDVLNTSGVNLAGDCATSKPSELACSLDADQTLSDATALTDGNGAENPQVTAGTMVPGHATTPWVAWDESNTNNGLHSVFVARLDPAGDHFDLLNGGQAISHSGLESTRPDIVFSHNIPYVSWHEASGSTTLTFVGHFEGNPANPTFHIDSPAAGIPTTSLAKSDDDVTDVRTAIASTCPADPFTADGATCQGGSIGTPFFAFTNGSPRALFAQGYQPDSVQTGTGSGTRTGQATLSGSVNPAGAPVNVRFDFGPTTGYGNSTAPQFLLGSPTLESQTGFSATVGSLRPGKYHFRAVAISDFGTFDGPDGTVTVPPPTVSSHPTSPHGSVKARKLKSIKGTATATFGVRKVVVAIVEFAGGAHVTSAKRLKPACEQLGRDGKLHKLRVGKHQLCTPTTFRTASGTTSWTLKLSRRLPKGTYVAISRATDAHGNVEKLGNRDRISFKVI